MPTEKDDDDPTIEAHEITLVDLLEFMGDLSFSPGVVAGAHRIEATWAGDLPECGSAEVQEALLQIFRAVSRARPRRRAMGLTLEQHAERAALEPNYVGVIENGRRVPLRWNLKALETAAKRLFGVLSSGLQEAVSAIWRAVFKRQNPPAPEGERGRDNDGGDGPSK